MGKNDEDELVPPDVLYHGVDSKSAGLIDMFGLIPKANSYVELTAKEIDKPVIYAVNVARMTADGYVFFLSETGEWMTKQVPRLYLTKETA